MVRGSRATFAPASSIRSSPPRTSVPEPASVSRSATASSRRIAAVSRSTASPVGARHSRSCCRVERPRLTPRSHEGADRAGMDLDYRRHPVVVVDDEPDILKLFRFNYGDEFEVVTAESGAGALELLGKADP